MITWIAIGVPIFGLVLAGITIRIDWRMRKGFNSTAGVMQMHQWRAEYYLKHILARL